MKDNNDQEKGTDSNENILELNENDDNLKKLNEQNFGELTQEQIELMKKIREETISRTERYSELISEPSSQDIFIKVSNNKNKKNNLIKKNDNDSIQTNNTVGITDNLQKEEINPNKERIFKLSQPILFIKEEPLIILGPNIINFIFIFSFVSFLSIIIYSFKNQNIFLKMLFFLGYLFFSITYILLLLINPGIPENKNKIDPSKLQSHYYQCKDCNCISLRQEEKRTYHCQICKICIEDFSHHSHLATKCIGKGNKQLYKIWLYSIGTFFAISFFYLII